MREGETFAGIEPDGWLHTCDEVENLPTIFNRHSKLILLIDLPIHRPRKDGTLGWRGKDSSNHFKEALHCNVMICKN